MITVRSISRNDGAFTAVDDEASHRRAHPSHVGSRHRLRAMYMPKPSPLMATPTRSPAKWLATATTNIARPYTTAAVSTETFHRPVRSESLPVTRDAATKTAA